MKKCGMKILTLLLIVSVFLSGCGGVKIEETTYQMPEWATEIAMPKASLDIDTELASAKVDIYYDNTWSMYGFAQQGNVVRMVNAFRDVINQYRNTTLYTLDSVGGYSEWMPYPGDFRNDFSRQEFYTYGSTRGNFKDGTGPLQMLYYQDNMLDSTAINVIVTDLAEQNVDMSDLATRINENIIAQEGYSAALIGIMGDFHGNRYISDLDKVDTMSGERIDQQIPLYILITGQDKLLSSYVRNLLDAFNNYQLVEEQDYFVARYQAGNSAKIVPIDSIIVSGAATEQDGMKKSDWETAEINENLSLRRVDQAHFDEYIKTDKILNMFVYEVDRTVNKVNPKRITLNYFIPIERSDGLTLPIHTKIYEAEEQATSSTVQEIYKNKDTIRFSQLMFNDEVESAEEWCSIDPSMEGIYGVPGKKEDEMVFVGWSQVNRITREKDVNISIELLNKGTPVYDMKLDEDGRDPDDLYEAVDLGYAANSDVLHVQVEFAYKPEKLESDTILLDIPVYAMAECVENIPDWVEKWDASNNGGDMMYHTFGLANFFRTLFGLNVTGDNDYDRALREVKIADILTCVSGLPTA